MRPFENIQVLDLTHVYAGPFCTYQLATLGADVIKVEPVDTPDMTRQSGADEMMNDAGYGINFQAHNAGKRALALNLKTTSGQEIFARLVRKADVLVQNYSGDHLHDIGLTYEQVSAINPRLIYCSMTGFGRTGPKANHPAYDMVIQAFSGMMASNGWAGDPPLKVGPPVVDYGTAMQAATAISAALFQRERTGLGQNIDVSMVDAALMLMADNVVHALITGDAPKAFGNSSLTWACHGLYQTSEGEIMLAAYTNTQMADLMQALGNPQAANALQAAHQRDILARFAEDKAFLTEALAQKSADHWEALLNAAHVPAAKVRTIEQAIAHPQVRARALLQDVPGGQGQLPVAAFTYAHGTPILTAPPPRHGEHTSEVLADLGYSESEIADFKSQGVC